MEGRNAADMSSVSTHGFYSLGAADLLQEEDEEEEGGEGGEGEEGKVVTVQRFINLLF